MSVINQMLKDLERRTRSHVSPEVTLSGLLSKESRDSRGQKKYFIVIFFILSFMIFFGIHSKKNNHPISLSSQTFIQNNTKKTLGLNDEKSAPDQIVLVPSILTGILLNVNQSTTDIRFLLNNDTFYTVVTDRTGTQLILTLDHTSLIADLPPVDYVKSAIQGMEMTNDKAGNLKITLNLKTGTELSYLNFTNGEKSPEIEMKLSAITLPAQNPLATALSPIKNFSVKKTEAFNATESYENAMSYSSLGENNKSIALLAGLLERYPLYALARQSLIELLLQEGNKSAALKLLQTGLNLQPNYPPLIEIKAHLLVDEGKVKEALALLEQTAPPIEKYPEFHGFIAALYQQQGQLQSAARLYEQLLKMYPNQTVWWVGLGIALEGMGKKADAKDIYVHATHLSGLNTDLRNFLTTRINNINT